jgi:hypothetical protein
MIGRLAAVFIVGLGLSTVCPTGLCQNQRILSGGLLPSAQGWSTSSLNGSPSVTTDGSSIRINTWDDYSQGSDSDILLFSHSFSVNTNAPKFGVEFSLQVHRAAYNGFDGGVMFATVGHQSAALTSNERSQMIMFGQDRVTWGDLSAAFMMNTTNVFHVYRFEVVGSDAKVYVDGNLALERTDYQTFGFIQFGDMSNDPSSAVDHTGTWPLAVNGDFSIAYIDIVPEPATWSLLAIGMGVLLIRRLRSCRS